MSYQKFGDGLNVTKYNQESRQSHKFILKPNIDCKFRLCVHAGLRDF